MATWAGNRGLLDQLERDIDHHGLVIIVGAGINGAAAPKWSELLAELTEQALQKLAISQPFPAAFQAALRARMATYNPLAQASLAKVILGPELYRLTIQRLIYKNIPNIDDLRVYCKCPEAALEEKFELLRIVAKLCHDPRVQSVVTFNFDTLLEEAIRATQTRERGRAPRSHFGSRLANPGAANSSNFISVYHAHGLIPHPQTLLRLRQSRPVMSYDEYFEWSDSVLSWEVSSLLHFLRHHCILWIGVSFVDDHMLWSLQAARSGAEHVRSYTIQKIEDSPPDGYLLSDSQIPSFTKVMANLRARLLDSFGVRTIYCPSHSAGRELLKEHFNID